MWMSARVARTGRTRRCDRLEEKVQALTATAVPHRLTLTEMRGRMSVSDAASNEHSYRKLRGEERTFPQHGISWPGAGSSQVCTTLLVPSHRCHIALASVRVTDSCRLDGMVANSGWIMNAIGMVREARSFNRADIGKSLSSYVRATS